MATFEIEIISTDGIIFKGEVEEVVVPTKDGQITILTNHAPLISLLDEGEVIIKKEGKQQILGVLGGFLEVNKNKAKIITDYAVEGSNIDVAKAEEAKAKAEELMKERKAGVDFALIEKDLKKSILELKVSEKVRKKGTSIQS
jgi:F-type H+-transporting ATPase subunit epsilon